MTNIHKFLMRGGPSTTSASDYVGKPGEITFNSDSDIIVVHDGSTPGGITIGGGGSLSGFTSSLDISGINLTTNLSKLLASSGTQPDQDIAIVPLGAGAFSLAVPTGDSIGGNKRGNRAVDLQIFESGKNSATQIASGWHSFACGSANTASSDFSFVEGWNNISSSWASHAEGQSNTASGTASHAEGNGNTVDSYASHVEGTNNLVTGAAGAHAEGGGNVVSADYAHGEGYQTRAAAQSSHAEGQNTIANGLGSNASGSFSTTRSIPFSQSYATSHFVTVGDSQTLRLRLNGISVGGSTIRMTIDGNSPTPSNQLPVHIHCTSLVNGKVVARDPSTGDSCGWTFSCCLTNISGTVAAVGVPAYTKDFSSSGAATTTWSVTIGPDDINKCFYVECIGSSGVDVYFSCELWAQEVVG